MKFFLKLLIYYLLSFLYAEDKIIENIRISENISDNSSRIVLDLSHKTPYSVFILSNKPRLVIDIEANKYREFLNKPSNIIKKIRIRKTDKEVIRVVFDLTRSAYILKNFYLDKKNNQFFRLVVDIKSNLKKANKIKASSKNKRKFIITIDPGHGGIDPGAINLGKKEKNITLKAAFELKKILEKKNYKVYLTRYKDEFISLPNRRRIAKKYKSDLFISLHVDSVSKKVTRGTSIYTLSEKASDKITARLAERENKVDMIAGVDLEKVDNEVASILLDLTRRDTKNSSSLFAENYIKFARKNGHRLLRRPHRHAGFAVLKSPDIPSVLIELGFLSNSRDVKLLTNPKTRIRLIQTLAKSIETYVKLRMRSFN